jgi:hypothetical protein
VRYAALKEIYEEMNQLTPQNLKEIATENKPNREGWYMWWDEPTDTAPFHVLALVKIRQNELHVNLNTDTNFNDFVPVSEVANRLWLQVSTLER